MSDEVISGGIKKPQNTIPLGTPNTSEVTLTNADTDYLLPSGELANRRLIVISNNSEYDIVVGETGEIDIDSIPKKGTVIPAGGHATFDNKTGLYAQCDTAGAKISVTEFA